MKDQISQNLKQIIQSEYSLDIETVVEVPRDESHGDLSTNVAMVIAGQKRKAGEKVNPVDIATNLTNKLKEKMPEIEISVLTPGFINFQLPKGFYNKFVQQVIAEKDSYGKGSEMNGKRIMIEFAHPNPFKAFHIGHLRNILLGEPISRLLKSQGAEVIKVNYQGDVGMHIAKCLYIFKDIPESEYPETPDEKVALIGKCYAKGAAAFEEDEAAKQEIKAINKKIYSKEDEEINQLWDLGKKWSLEKFKEIYARVGTSFVREYMESEVTEEAAKQIDLAIERGILEESEGAIVFNGEKYGLDTRVFRNSEGLPTYEGKELGLAKFEFTDYGDIDLCIHNVAVEQISFFKVTFKVQELLHPELYKGKQYHNAYEFVGLKSGKMSSRKGQVVLGNDVLNESTERIMEIIKDNDNIENKEETAEKIGVGAVKYSFLKISPFKYLAFDFDSSLSFEGDSGPYIQYTYARSQSILRQFDGDINSITLEKGTLSSEEEIVVTKLISRFPETVARAANDYSPSYVANYLQELATAFNKFYANHSVLKAENEMDLNARILLSVATSQVLKSGLNLLGIETVEKM